MPLSTRSRPPRTTGGPLASTENRHVTAVAKPAAVAASIHHNIVTTVGSGVRIPEVGEELPPAKRRKLSIRGKQTTLEHFIVPQSHAPKPPAKLTRTQPPHGQLVQTNHDVRNANELNKDTHSLPSSLPLTPTNAPLTDRRPAVAEQEDKRTLRSQDEGPKLKSELAIYFPNYDEIIFDPPKAPEFVTVDSTIYIADDTPKAQNSASAGTAKSPNKIKGSPSNARNTNSHASLLGPSTPQRASLNQFNGSPFLNLDFVAKTLPEHPEDPLNDEFYLKAHRRAERKEKQLRNIEKERAMHEKVQLDRLLDGLLGHDWLRVMGITAITDLEARKYEPKRQYFIAEVQALVDKFKEWKELEKKLKLQKENPIVNRGATEERESDEGSVGPPSSDLNASAALQLQQETASAIKSANVAAAVASKANKVKEAPTTPVHSKPPAPFVPPPPEIPITSFYEKRHLRDAALGKSRHGRNVTAFGQPIPDVPEQDFELPEDYATEDAIRSNARERRRRKRASAVEGNSSSL